MAPIQDFEKAVILVLAVAEDKGEYTAGRDAKARSPYHFSLFLRGLGVEDNLALEVYGEEEIPMVKPDKAHREVCPACALRTDVELRKKLAANTKAQADFEKLCAFDFEVIQGCPVVAEARRVKEARLADPSLGLAAEAPVRTRIEDRKKARALEEARKMEERYGAPTSFADRYKGR